MKMIKYYKWLWNSILVVVVILSCVVIIPKALASFQELEGIEDEWFKLRCQMVGVEGVGLLLVIVLGSFSLSTYFFQKCRVFYRIVFILLSVFGEWEKNPRL